MNKILTTIVFALVLVVNVFAQEKAILAPVETKYDWGNVYMGEKVEHEFKFINKGNAPLIVYEATSSCGCTVPEAPKKPILPGEMGFVKVVFDSKGRVDRQNKSVTVKANTQPEYTTFYLTGMIYNKPTTVQLSIEEQLQLKKKQREEERIAKEKAELAKIEAERANAERLYKEQEARKKRKEMQEKRMREIELEKRKALDAKNKAMNAAIKNSNKNTTQNAVEKITETKEIKTETVPKIVTDTTKLKPTTVIVNKNDKNYMNKLKSFF